MSKETLRDGNYRKNNVFTDIYLYMKKIVRLSSLNKTTSSSGTGEIGI